MSSNGYVFDTSEVTKGITTLCVQKVIKVNTGKYFFVEFFLLSKGIVSSSMINIASTISLV